MIKKDFPSAGTYLDTNNSILYISWSKNRAVDWDTGRTIARFGHVNDSEPTLSPQGKYLALANRYKGIEIIDTSDYHTIYHRSCKRSSFNSYHDSTFWISDHVLLFAYSTGLYTVDVSDACKEKELISFDYNSFPMCGQPDKKRAMFISSMDFDKNKVLLSIYGYNNANLILLQVDLISMRVEYKMVSGVFNSFVYDKKGGYFTSDAWGALYHFDSITEQNKLPQENREKQLFIEANSVVLSSDGKMIALTMYPFDTKAVIYKTTTWSLIKEIPFGLQSFSSMRFSEDDRYFFISGSHTVICDLRDADISRPGVGT